MIVNTLSQKYAQIVPAGAGVIFFIQLFSTFPFSVLYSTMVLYATTGLKLSDAAATEITASFVALNYALHLISGYMGGRLISYRLLFSIGMAAQFAGCLLLAASVAGWFYWGLAFFLTGSGLSITCINCMLTQLFKPDDKRREAAFLWNYSGMNIGFFMGFALSGYFQLHHGYHQLFILSSLGNFIALIIALTKWKILKDIHTRYARLSASKKGYIVFKGFFIIIILLLIIRWLLEHASISNNLIIGIGIIMLFVIAGLAIKQPIKENANKMWAYLLLALTSLVFWTLYQLAPIGLTLFMSRNVNLYYYGIQIAPQWAQNIITIIIIVGAPLLGWVFTGLRNRGVQITIPLQFSVGLILIGMAMAILPIGIYFASPHGYVNFNWVLFSFILKSLGELFIVPIGYAMVGQLAPVKLQGIMMGAWLMIIGVATTLSGYFSSLAATANSSSIDPLVTNARYSHVFGYLGLTAMSVGVILLFCTPFIVRLTLGKR